MFKYIYVLLIFLSLYSKFSFLVFKIFLHFYTCDNDDLDTKFIFYDMLLVTDYLDNLFKYF